MSLDEKAAWKGQHGSGDVVREKRDAAHQESTSANTGEESSFANKEEESTSGHDSADKNEEGFSADKTVEERGRSTTSDWGTEWAATEPDPGARNLCAQADWDAERSSSTLFIDSCQVFVPAPCLWMWMAKGS